MTRTAFELVCVGLTTLALAASPVASYRALAERDQRSTQLPSDQPAGEYKEADEESRIIVDEFKSMLYLAAAVVAEPSSSASTDRIDDVLARPHEPVLHGRDCPRAPPQLSC